jgi:crossover junction endodeoxyribonuclease RusA
LVLPYPPSANRLWRAGRGHVHLSPAYTQWLDEAGWHVAEQRRGHIRGPYRLGIAALRFDRRKRDLDNLIKPINDRLGVVEDDCLAELISVRWVTSGPPVTVRVEAAGVE